MNKTSVILALMLVFALPSYSHADPLEEKLLVQVAIAETGWVSRNDRFAVWHLLQRRSTKLGWDLPRMIRAYSSPLKRKHWATGVTSACRRPPKFPRGMNWGRYKPKCIQLFDEAKQFLAGNTPDPCNGKAEHFGDRKGDKARATSFGWTRVDCGRTGNLFWSTRTND